MTLLFAKLAMAVLITYLTITTIYVCGSFNQVIPTLE